MKITNIEEGMPHKVSEVICIRCGHRWIAVRPEGTLLKTLECPMCDSTGFVIETGEDILNQQASEVGERTLNKRSKRKRVRTRFSKPTVLY